MYANSSRAVSFSTGSREARVARPPALVSARTSALPGDGAPSASGSSSSALGSAAAADLAAYSMRNGGSRYWLICEYFDIICRNSGLEARFQSMQRVAPCASVKEMDQV